MRASSFIHAYMSTLAYRTWDLWINTSFFTDGQTHEGYFECVVHDALMVSQSIEFLAEGKAIFGRKFLDVAQVSADMLRANTRTQAGEPCIRIYETLNTAQDLINTIEAIRRFIDSMALAVDAPLSCFSVRFISHQYGKILQANRRTIGRGVGFEVEERGIAKEKIRADLDFYQDDADHHATVGRRHYMAGMQILALEDQVAGLLDAAFMQFYQGCEVLCRDPKGALEASKKYIALQSPQDSRELQIIAHQVWGVRHKYFGHGDVQHNLYANKNKEQAAQVARQVLVARYLCRRLIDLAAPSGTVLAREMGLFFGSYSGSFTGQVSQLLDEFKVPFGKPECKTFDAQGTEGQTFTFPTP